MQILHLIALVIWWLGAIWDAPDFISALVVCTKSIMAGKRPRGYDRISLVVFGLFFLAALHFIIKDW